MKVRFIGGACLATVLFIWHTSGWADEETGWLPAEAETAVALALRYNPRLTVARSAWTADTQRVVAHDGFYQPRLTAAAGASRGPGTAPESLLSPRLPGDAASLQAGLHWPLRAGIRLGAGLSHRFLFEADGFDDLGQTVAGLRLEMPLLRDRGFRLQQNEQRALNAQADAAGALADAVLQDLALATLVAYANRLYAAAELLAATQALQRVTLLSEETAARVALRATPEAQIFPARMEVAIHRQTWRAAQANLLIAGQQLEELLGGPRLPSYPEAAQLRAWASNCVRCAIESVPGWQQAGRPELLVARQQRQAAEHRLDSANEQRRSDLQLVAGIGYRGESENGTLGRDNLLDERRAGVEAALVWSRPWSFMAEDAQQSIRRAELAGARETLRQVQLRITSELRQAEESLAAARERMTLVDQAVFEARRALGAEEERLRMGEGRSRNVLDAQKDLTTAERLANQTAFETVRAFATLLHAAGIPLAAEE